MKCHLCHYYEAKDQKDLALHLQYGHTRKQILGDITTDESLYPVLTTPGGSTAGGSPPPGFTTISSIDPTPFYETSGGTTAQSFSFQKINELYGNKK